jgi:hypothetical protein
MKLDINSEEVGLLSELLRREYQELREEIYKTEDHRFKAGLRRKEQLLDALLNKLDTPVAKSA